MPRRGSPSPLLNLPLLIVILPIIALILLFFALPSLLSLTSHKIRPITNTTVIKSSWDSLYIFLVLFTILCGIFARRNDDESTTNEDNPSNHDKSKPHSVSNAPWFADDFSEPKIYANTNNSTPLGGTATAATGDRLKMNSRSYPDLMQDSFWETPDDRFRFFDDFEINKYRSPIHHRRHRNGVFEESCVKDIPVDTFVSCSSSKLQSPPPLKTSAPPPPPPPPPPPTTTKSNHKQKRTYRTLPSEIEKANENDLESTKIKTSPPTPPPPPPRHATPAPPKKMHGKSERKRTNATKEIKMVLASLYRKKTKKQKTQVLPKNDTLRSPSEPPSSTRPPPPPPPPPRPPPPPPPPSVFHFLFRKNSKSKRIHSFSPPPAPPPPPTTKRLARHKSQVPLPPPEPPRRRRSSTTGQPPLPTGVNNLYVDNVNNGGQSPLVAMPPLPPAPPCQMPGFQFVPRGDLVEKRSAQGSRCSSPDSEEVDKESSRQTVNKTDGKDGIGGPSFCPSPDVNMKADTFIARLRDGWRLEKINSLREKGSGDHGPGTDPTKI